MLRKNIHFALPFLFFVTQAFTPPVGKKWSATIELEGPVKSIFLTSDAVYGGYNNDGKKFFFFGKNHTFKCKTNFDDSKVFNDFCITNASGKFEFELNNVDNPTIPAVASGNLSFKRKQPIQGSLSIDENMKGSIQVQADFNKMGLILTSEASKVMTGKFILTITEKSEN